MTEFLDFVLERLPQAPARVLEVGCGPEGGVTPALAKAGFDVLGIDPRAPGGSLFRGVTLEEIGGAALYLLSDLSTGVTGDIHFVDSGYNIITMPQPAALKDGNEADNGNGGEAAKDAAQ